MPIAAANGIDLHYRIEGEGPETVLLVNGLADDLETWELQVPALLEAGYRVIRYDNRGVGRSAKPAGPYTTQLMADDAAALVEALGIDDYHVMGISMGGMIAQHLALSHPRGIRSLTLACTYAAPGPFCSRMYAMWADAARLLGVPFVMRDVTLWAFTLDFFERREPELREFEEQLGALDQPVEAYLAQLSSIQTHDATAELGSLEPPTLVLAGADDILIPTALSHRLHELIPGSEWATTPGGHACIWEHPDEFNRVFIDFLRRRHG